jgi:O-antigen/teichoic acid export membrane protein
MALPKLIDAHRRSGMAGWRGMMIAEGSRATAVAVALSVPASLVALLLLPHLGFDGFATDIPFFLLMVAAALVKPLGDLTNAGLYSLKLDRRLVAINLGGVVASVILGVAATHLLGLIGIGIAALAGQAALIAMRLHQFDREASRH